MRSRETEYVICETTDYSSNNNNISDKWLSLKRGSLDEPETQRESPEDMSSSTTQLQESPESIRCLKAKTETTCRQELKVAVLKEMNYKRDDDTLKITISLWNHFLIIINEQRDDATLIACYSTWQFRLSAYHYDCQETLMQVNGDIHVLQMIILRWSRVSASS